MTFILQMSKKNQDQVNDLSSQIYREPEPNHKKSSHSSTLSRF